MEKLEFINYFGATLALIFGVHYFWPYPKNIVGPHKTDSKMVCHDNVAPIATEEMGSFLMLLLQSRLEP